MPQFMLPGSMEMYERFCHEARMGNEVIRTRLQLKAIELLTSQRALEVDAYNWLQKPTQSAAEAELNCRRAMEINNDAQNVKAQAERLITLISDVSWPLVSVYALPADYDGSENYYNFDTITAAAEKQVRRAEQDQSLLNQRMPIRDEESTFWGAVRSARELTACYPNCGGRPPAPERNPRYDDDDFVSMTDNWFMD